MRRYFLSAVTLAILASAIFAQDASRFRIEKPDGRENFISDQANLITPEDSKAINAKCKALLHDQAVPLIIVTVPSMASCGPGGLSIETYARELFDSWGIGHPDTVINGKKVSWNHGILLLVSSGDRKARIELGADWANKRNKESQNVMDNMIIPFFKAGDYSQGIVQGVGGLDKIGRGLRLPGGGVSDAHVRETAGNALLSLLMYGGFGVFGLFLAALGPRNRGGYSGGGGFSGGSFGGGFGGGGGASGSW